MDEEELYPTLASIHDDDDDAPSTSSVEPTGTGNEYVPGDSEEFDPSVPGVHTNEEKGDITEYTDQELLDMGIIDDSQVSQTKHANSENDIPLPGEEGYVENVVPNEEGPLANGSTTEVSGIEKLLSEFNIEGGMVDFGDADGKVHFDTLDSTDQYAVLKQLWEENSTFEEQQKSLEEDEIQLINHIRSSEGGVRDVIAGLAEERARAIVAEQSSMGEDYTNMNPDSLYVKFLRERNPNITSEDVESKLDAAKSNEEMFTDFVSGYQESLIRQQQDTQREIHHRSNQERMESLEEDRKLIARAASEVDSVAGFVQDDEMKNAVLEGIMETNEEGDSLFMEQVFSDPKELYRVKWLADYGEQFIQQRESYWKQELTKAFNRGRTTVVEGLQTEPINSRRLPTREKPAPKKQTPKHEGLSLADIHDD